VYFMKNFVSFVKKPVLVAGLVSALVASGSANASLGDFKFYVGAGADYNTYGLHGYYKGANTHKTNGMGLVPVLGVKFHENFGVEVGYSFNKKFKFANTTNSITGSVNAKVKNAYIDLMGFVPIADQFEFIGGVGLGRLTVKPGSPTLSGVPAGTASSSSVSVKNKTSWRVKLGAQYNINNNFGVRALATYQHVGNKANTNITVGANSVTKTNWGTFVKNMKSIGLAATYTF